MRRLLYLLSFSALLFGADAANPWTGSDLLSPAEVASQKASPAGPLIIHVGFSVLYRAAHITGSAYAGPASKPEGIDELKKAVAGQPRSREIILYCGCCPWDKCPNIRPAFAALRDAGFKNVKVIMMPENLKADWIDKGYSTDKRAAE